MGGDPWPPGGGASSRFHSVLPNANEPSQDECPRKRLYAEPVPHLGAVCVSFITRVTELLITAIGIMRILDFSENAAEVHVAFGESDFLQSRQLSD